MVAPLIGHASGGLRTLRGHVSDETSVTTQPRDEGRKATAWTQAHRTAQHIKCGTTLGCRAACMEETQELLGSGQKTNAHGAHNWPPISANHAMPANMAKLNMVLKRYPSISCNLCHEDAVKLLNAPVHTYGQCSTCILRCCPASCMSFNMISIRQPHGAH